ncbi:MAG: DNA repair protein RecN [Bacteroidetes bacterium]|nr:DNA repair protein RecN [Bacteroidota bacterium]
MLRQLLIHNYAIIQDLDVAFGPGLTVITGETGAGKSILLGALGLVLGKRADTRVLFDLTKKCVVEGRFDISAYDLQSFFAENDLDHEAETVIRREINANGKSRAFVNDTPVNLGVLDALAARLINIHSQHETLDLNSSRFQTSVLDSLAGNDEKLKAYGLAYAAWQTLRSTYAARCAERDRALAERDYLQFQFDELAAARLDGLDESALEAELSALQHAEETKRGLAEATECLQGDQGAVLTGIRQAIHALRPLLRWREDLQPLMDRLESLRIEGADLAAALEQAGESTAWDPGKITGLEQRLDEVNRLLHKHRLPKAADLVALRDQLDNKLVDQDREGDALEKMGEALRQAGQQVTALAAELSSRRQKACPGLEKSVGKLLGEVGMPDARLSVELKSLPEPGPSGQDQVQFLFASNKGSRLEDLRQVASGGELSRLMLSIKSLVAAKKALPTLIFDEIDSGVSGETGRRIGVIMEEMAGNHQIVAITHLPQIAACGKRHLFVYKETKGKQTHTRLRELLAEERVEAIARMISGEQLSDAARANARELLSAT